MDNEDVIKCKSIVYYQKLVGIWVSFALYKDISILVLSSFFMVFSLFIENNSELSTFYVIKGCSVFCFFLDIVLLLAMVNKHKKFIEYSINEPDKVSPLEETLKVMDQVIFFVFSIGLSLFCFLLFLS